MGPSPLSYLHEQHLNMAEQYNQAIATHYAAYRPPLHQMILGRVISEKETFHQGLDVGCGTGYSAVALAPYCHHVYGVEPSASMLSEAMPHERVTYLKGTGEALALPDSSVDVVTFAGALFYAKSDALITELQRVCSRDAWVIPYDFEIVLDDVLQQFGFRPEEATPGYDHTVNFSDIAAFTEIVVASEHVSLGATASEIAHIVLSDLQRYEAFVEKFGTSDPYPALTSALEETGVDHVLKANIYFAKYQLNTE